MLVTKRAVWKLMMQSPLSSGLTTIPFIFLLPSHPLPHCQHSRQFEFALYSNPLIHSLTPFQIISLQILAGCGCPPFAWVLSTDCISGARWALWILFWTHQHSQVSRLAVATKRSCTFITWYRQHLASPVRKFVNPVVYSSLSSERHVAVYILVMSFIVISFKLLVFLK